MLKNLFYFLIVFLILLFITVFPHFRQTKKNLIWLVFIFILVSCLMINDFGIEFLPLAYLLIYVGAVAVMFLFVIVAVDSKYENQIELFELNLPLVLLINNFLTSILYLIFSRGHYPSFFDANILLDFREELKFSQNFLGYVNTSTNFFYREFVLNSGCLYDDLSLYSFIEYRAKDIYVFSEYFYNNHSFLLIIVGFILTVAMLVSLLIAKDFSFSKK